MDESCTAESGQIAHKKRLEDTGCKAGVRETCACACRVRNSCCRHSLYTLAGSCCGCRGQSHRTGDTPAETYSHKESISETLGLVICNMSTCIGMVRAKCAASAEVSQPSRVLWGQRQNLLASTCMHMGWLGAHKSREAHKWRRGNRPFCGCRECTARSRRIRGKAPFSFRACRCAPWPYISCTWTWASGARIWSAAGLCARCPPAQTLSSSPPTSEARPCPAHPPRPRHPAEDMEACRTRQEAAPAVEPVAVPAPPA